MITKFPGKFIVWKMLPLFYVSHCFFKEVMYKFFYASMKICIRYPA